MFHIFFLCVLLIPLPDGRGIQVSNAEAVTVIPNYVCQKMWDSATNNLIVGKDLQVDPCNIPNLLIVTPSGQAKLKQPVFTEFQDLVDSYNPGSVVPPAEKVRRQNVFLNTLLVQDRPVDVAYQYLKNIGKTTAPDLKAFSAELRTAWFGKYKKKKTKGLSSGFEHHFVGELRGKRKTLKHGGFHSWYQFYIEKYAVASRLTDVSVNSYKGNNPLLLDVGFTWQAAVKKRSGNRFFVGTSPAFEMALFSACFLGVMGPGLPTSQRCTCDINLDPVMIQAVAKDRYIITTYPR